MAWDSKACPWDWHTEAVLSQGHGGESRKRAHESGWASEAQTSCFAAGHGAPQSGVGCCNVSGLGTSVAPFASASSNGILASGIGIQSTFGYVNQRVAESSRNRTADRKKDCEVDYPDGEHNRGHDNGKTVDERNVGFLELGGQASSSYIGLRNPATVIREKKGDLIVAGLQQAESSIGPGKFFLPAGGHDKDTKQETGSQSIKGRHYSAPTGSAGSGDSLTGLHLGKRVYVDDVKGSAGTEEAQKPPGSKPAPVKKPRPASGVVQTPRCQVAGCNIDLTSAKGYHRRHKVCEIHSKAEKVTVADQEQRFCQQCSRFHVLAEFDAVKRSCRRRLAGHNERRRKPQLDPLALSARLPSAFQEWPLFHHTRFSGLSSWDDPGDLRSLPLKGSWPRMIKFEDQSSYDHSVQTPGMERQMFFSSLLPQVHDKVPLLLLQSPKEMISMPSNVSNHRFYQYLPGYNGPVGNGITHSSSSGAGVLSGLEATSATQVVTRVADSGCALSLLSAQTRGSHAPNAVSLDLSARTSITIDQYMSDEHTAIPEQLLHGGQLPHFDYRMEKMLSIGSDSQNQSSANIAGMSSTEKDHYGGSISNGLNGEGTFESHSFFSTIQGHEPRHPQDVKPTIDLMGILSVSQNGHPQGPSVAFQLGSCPFGDFQYADEPSFFDSQQRM